MPHPSKDGVDKLMLHIQRAVSLRAEAARWEHTETMLKYKGDNHPVPSRLAWDMREEVDDALKDAENMVYELIDGAVERSVDHAYRSIRQSAAVTGRRLQARVAELEGEEDV